MCQDEIVTQTSRIDDRMSAELSQFSSSMTVTVLSNPWKQPLNITFDFGRIYDVENLRECSWIICFCNVNTNSWNLWFMRKHLFKKIPTKTSTAISAKSSRYEHGLCPEECRASVHTIMTLFREGSVLLVQIRSRATFIAFRRKLAPPKSGREEICAMSSSSVNVLSNSKSIEVVSNVGEKNQIVSFV